MSTLQKVDFRSGSVAPDEVVVPAIGRAVEQARAPCTREVPRPEPTVRGPDTSRHEQHAGEKAGQRNRWQLWMLLAIVGIFLVGVAAGLTWLRGGRYVSTDDAYVQAAKLMVSTDVSGIVSSVDVHEDQVVKRGDILFRVDPRQFQIALDNANANLAQTAQTIESMKQDYKRMLSDVGAQQAQVGLDQATYDRYATVRLESISRVAYDQARFSLEADKSKLESLRRQAEMQLARLVGNANIPVMQHPQYVQAKAQVDEAQRQLDHTVVRAPSDGVVTQVDGLQLGTYLVSQTAAMTSTGAVGLVSTDDVWVVANMKETDLTYVKPGDHVNVWVASYPDQVWSATVQSISPASRAQFSIFLAQKASGNWGKVVQRIPVRIRIDRESGNSQLRAGMSATVDIDTTHRRMLSNLL
jgi:membrane fusion protein (multidrug efflux system)